MKKPYNTRPYAVRPKPGAEARRRAVMLYVAAVSGPIAAMVMAAAAAVTLH